VAALGRIQEAPKPCQKQFLDMPFSGGETPAMKSSQKFCQSTRSRDTNCPNLGGSPLSPQPRI